MKKELVDNNRETHPYIYTGSQKDKEDAGKYGYAYGDYTNDMHPCGYCGIWFAASFLHQISVTRNNKTRRMWRCESCQNEMKIYKITTE